MADLPGTYIAQLTVSDGTLTSDPDTVTITTGNTAPVANAGPDPARTPFGLLVAFDGRGSSDADGHALHYTWSIVARPGGSVAMLDDASSATPAFTPDGGGDYVIQLIVNDGFVSSPPDTVVVAVNRVPVANAGTDRSVAPGAPVTLDASGSDAESDVLTFFWTLTGPPGSAAALSNPSSRSPSFTPDIVGSYEARLLVYDGYNNSAPDSVLVTVAAQASLSVSPGSLTLLTRAKGSLTISSSEPAGASGLEVTLTSTR